MLQSGKKIDFIVLIFCFKTCAEKIAGCIKSKNIQITIPFKSISRTPSSLILI